MDALTHAEPLSWRDPDGFVVKDQGRILRAVAAAKAAQTRALLAAPWMTRLIAAGHIPRTLELSGPPPSLDASRDWLWLEHEEVSFPCFPHEITALQLYDAGRLTLQLAIEAAEHGWVLKDASAWNVLYSRGKPVFVDFLSFDPQAPTGTWIAYGQFVRHFLLPLLLYRHLGLTPAELFLTNRDGIPPERAADLLSRTRLLSPIGLELVLLPKWLSGSGSRLIAGQSAAQSAGKTRRFAPDVAKAILLRTLRRLQGLLDRLRPETSRLRSTWASYEEERAHYSEPDLLAKRDFVRAHLGQSATVLDLGANAGEFSLLAAESGAEVVAADADHAALLRLYARLRVDLPAGTRAVSPLVLNIARPTPAIGWENREVLSFLERATGRFDCVLALGLLHHLLVSERASLPMLLDLLARLEPQRIILEWIDPQDPKFRQLAGLNAGLYRDLDVATMERHLARKFRLIAKAPLPSAARVMYHWSR
jgi:SAM-dependent methyltransferase